MAYDTLDDAAAAALLMLTLEQDPKLEHMGALYAAGDAFERTPTVTKSDAKSVGGKLAVPRGSLRALFHNHPPAEPLRGDVRHDVEGERAKFSNDDITQARALGVPSYIAVDDRVRRYDPRTKQTSDVLAQFPIDEFRSFLMKKLLDRAPDDPRGLMR